MTTMRGSFALPCDTPSSAPNPSRAISRGPSTSTFSPSSLSFLQRSAISAGLRTFGGSLTRSRDRNTPFATPCSGSQADLARGGSEVSSVSLLSFGLSSGFSLVRYRSNR